VTERAAAERRVRESEQRLQLLIDRAPDGIVVADLDSRYTDANEAACRMLGYSRDDLIGLRITDLIHEADEERLWAERDTLLAGGSDVGEWQLLRKDGRYLPVEVSATILPDGRWQAFLRDIGERTALATAVRELAAIVESSDDAIIGKTLTGGSRAGTPWPSGCTATPPRTRSGRT
jgi:two-component system cell cycle sensor histidine kinase/response regulator CckA